MSQADLVQKQVAPFRLTPYFQTRIWGFKDLKPWYAYATEGEPIGEVWLTGDACHIETGPLAGTSFKDLLAQHSAELMGPTKVGQGFPLLIKMIFPKEKLSVQVHPDDALAQKYGEPRGKTECWYAMDAEPDANVALGIKKGVTIDQMKEAISAATLEKLLEWLPIQKGDMVYVDAGTVHAIAPGSILLEVQQNSDVTYRLYDYGRPRQLHLEKSFEALRLDTKAGKVKAVVESDREILIDETYFRIEKLGLDGKYSAEAIQGRQSSTPSSFQLLFAAQGEITISGEGFESFQAPKGYLAVIPHSALPWNVEAASGSSVIRILPKEPKH